MLSEREEAAIVFSRGVWCELDSELRLVWARRMAVRLLARSKEAAGVARYGAGCTGRRGSLSGVPAETDGREQRKEEKALSTGARMAATREGEKREEERAGEKEME